MDRRQHHSQSQFQFEFQSAPESVKMQQGSTCTRNEIEHTFQNGTLLAWKEYGKGMTNAPRGHFFTLAVDFCSHIVFSDLWNERIPVMSHSLLRLEQLNGSQIQQCSSF